MPSHRADGSILARSIIHYYTATPAHPPTPANTRQHHPANTGVEPLSQVLVLFLGYWFMGCWAYCAPVIRGVEGRDGGLNLFVARQGGCWDFPVFPYRTRLGFLCDLFWFKDEQLRQVGRSKLQELGLGHGSLCWVLFVQLARKLELVWER